MGGKYSHEFLVINANGEDHMWLCDSCHTSLNEELLQDTANVACPSCQNQMKREKAIEVGHTFYLGTRYSEKFKANFRQEAGTRYERIEKGMQLKALHSRMIMFAFTN
jgi:prolyl-tRNA synthetase